MKPIKVSEIILSQDDSVSLDTTLEPIARGDTEAGAAGEIISGCLQDASPEQLRQIYSALRKWTWKALMARRTDKDLDGWFELIRGVQSYTVGRDDTTAHKFGVLCELVEDSIRFREANPHEALLKRRHMRTLLLTIRRRNGAWVDRQVLAVELALGEANLSTLLSTLVGAGKLDRELDGREARFRLTLDGIALADQLVDVQPVQPPAEPVAGPQRKAMLENLDRAQRELDNLKRAQEKIEASIQVLQSEVRASPPAEAAARKKRPARSAPREAVAAG